MSRVRITARGEKVELRGYMDVDSLNEVGRFFADDVDERAVIVVSEAPDDYDPFGISEPSHPPTPDASIDIIRGMWEASEGPEEFLTNMSMLHYGQANVIRGERGRAERAEKELQARELHHFEVEQENARLHAQFASPPAGWSTLGTQGHAETPMEFWGDDAGLPIWERPKSDDDYTRMMVARVDAAEGEVDGVRAEASEIADALSDNWEQGDLAGAVNSAITFLRGLAESA